MISSFRVEFNQTEDDGKDFWVFWHSSFGGDALLDRFVTEKEAREYVGWHVARIHRREETKAAIRTVYRVEVP